METQLITKIINGKPKEYIRVSQDGKFVDYTFVNKFKDSNGKTHMYIPVADQLKDLQLKDAYIKKLIMHYTSSHLTTDEINWHNKSADEKALIRQLGRSQYNQVVKKDNISLLNHKSLESQADKSITSAITDAINIYQTIQEVYEEFNNSYQITIKDYTAKNKKITHFIKQFSKTYHPETQVTILKLAMILKDLELKRKWSPTLFTSVELPLVQYDILEQNNSQAITLKCATHDDHSHDESLTIITENDMITTIL